MPRGWPTVEQEELTSFVSACFNPGPIRYIFTWSLRSYPRRCPQSTTETVTGTAPQAFLDYGEGLKHFTGGGHLSASERSARVRQAGEH
jgi:hypothetical protein